MTELTSKVTTLSMKMEENEARITLVKAKQDQDMRAIRAELQAGLAAVRASAMSEAATTTAGSSPTKSGREWGRPDPPALQVLG